MLAKTIAAAMAALVIGSASVAVARSYHHQAPGYGYSYGYSYGEAPNEQFRDNACATGCGV